MSEYKRLTNPDYKETGIQTYIGSQNPYEVPLTLGEMAALPEANYSPKEILKEVFNRLAQYEDIGSPEEFAELAKAKAENRILPEGFACLMLSNNKHLAVWYPEDKGVVCEKRRCLEPSALKQNGCLEDKCETCIAHVSCCEVCGGYSEYQEG